MQKEEFLKKTYCKALTRERSLFEIKAWHEGESKELEKWLGFGFFNHLFVSKNRLVTLYYDLEEGEKFHKILKQKLTEELFDNLCDYFFDLIEKSENISTDEKIYDIMVKSTPTLAIFDEISKYQEFANDSMIKRLIRTRKATEHFSYDLAKKINHKPDLKDYIFFKGQLILKPFNDFKKENNIVIKDE